MKGKETSIEQCHETIVMPIGMFPGTVHVFASLIHRIRVNYTVALCWCGILKSFCPESQIVCLCLCVPLRLIVHEETISTVMQIICSTCS